MNLIVQKWGNSLALRIPKAIARQVNVQQGSRVDMTLDSNKIILSAIKVEKYRLGDLLSGVTKLNMHQEIDFGSLKGKEIW